VSDDIPYTITGLLDGYRSRRFSPREVIDSTLARLVASGDRAVWIGDPDPERIRADADRVAAVSPSGPLGGVPFAVKDNIDVAGIETTAGCPAFGSVPAVSAAAVDHLTAAGAIVIGKTNLDQFATGLVGTRSPYGTPRNPFDSAVVPGGSSSGSGVAVATGIVPFALGTDTAGSGRVPAAFGNIIGCKPTHGLVSTKGVVPACRSLDCVSVFALTARDAALVLASMAHPDEADVYSRPIGARRQRAVAAPDDIVLGIPDDSILERCDPEIAEMFEVQLKELAHLGVRLRQVDVGPFLDVGDLLYDGPWLAERDATVGEFIDAHAADVHPITRDIISGARRFSATDMFRAEYRRRELARQAATVWVDVDAIVVPSVPTVPTLVDVEADPIGINARLGMFSTFVNLLDLCAVAVPGGLLASGLPVGFTLVAPACSDWFLLDLADRYQRMVDRTLGATGSRIGSSDAPLVVEPAASVPLAVVGAHLAGQPLNHQLVERGARLAARTTTAPRYRLVALADTTPAKPGLVRVDDDGAAIEVEVWDMPIDQFGSFVDGVPAPLAIGKLELADGSWVNGFVCEPVGIERATDITRFRGWRSYLQSL